MILLQFDKEILISLRFHHSILKLFLGGRNKIFCQITFPFRNKDYFRAENAPIFKIKTYNFLHGHIILGQGERDLAQVSRDRTTNE